MIENIDKTNLLKTFLKYAIPCIIGMFLTSFITIVDGMFIGWKLGEKGLAAVNLTLPVLYVLLGITIMIGVGGVTLAMQSMGEKSIQQANRRFTFTILLNFAFNIFAAVILIIFKDSIIGFLNAKGVIYSYVSDYLGTMGYFYTFMMMNITFSMFIRGEGKPQLSLLFNMMANILNIALDYIFLIRLDYGMRGAALASGLSVIVAFTLGFLYFISEKSVFRYVKISFDIDDFKNMVFNGSSEFIGQISLSITTFLLNGFNIVASAYFTSIGDAKTSALISMLRSLVLISIFILILPNILGHTGIWLAAPLTEAVTLVVAYVCIKKSRVRLKFENSSEPIAVEA
jgi:Na+-driven multidrug efflux pump